MNSGHTTRNQVLVGVSTHSCFAAPALYFAVWFTAVLLSGRKSEETKKQRMKKRNKKRSVNFSQVIDTKTQRIKETNKKK